MRHPQLAILGYSEAAMFLRGRRESDIAAIISIHGTGEFGVDANVSDRLDLEFDDADVPPPDDSFAMQKMLSRRRWAAENGLHEVPPMPEDAARIIEFANQIRDVNGAMLCHCAGGISRAPAAGLICLATWRGAGAEEECVAELRRLRPAAMPHIGLVRFADELLGRKNMLVEAIAAARP